MFQPCLRAPWGPALLLSTVLHAALGHRWHTEPLPRDRQAGPLTRPQTISQSGGYKCDGRTGSGLEIPRGFKSSDSGIMGDHLCLNCSLYDDYQFLTARATGWERGIMKAKSLNSQISWPLTQTPGDHGADQRKYICKPSRNNRKKNR